MTTNKPEYAFFGGKIVPIGEAKVSVMTNSFNYGTGVFAGMRAYWNDDEHQLFIFRATDHFERFRQSAGLMRIDVAYSESELTDILIELLRIEDYHENVYIRPLAYKSSEMIGVVPERSGRCRDDFRAADHAVTSPMYRGCTSAFRRGGASRTMRFPRAAKSLARMPTPR